MAKHCIIDSINNDKGIEMKSIIDTIVKTYQYEMSVYGFSLVPVYFLLIIIVITSGITL